MPGKGLQASQNTADRLAVAARYHRPLRGELRVWA